MVTDRFVAYNIHPDLFHIDYHNFTIFHFHRISFVLKPTNVMIFVVKYYAYINDTIKQDDSWILT